MEEGWTLHYCVDYRPLNKLMVKDCFSLALIQECIDTLRGSIFISTMDMVSGYWQISIKLDKTAKDDLNDEV